MSGTKSAIIKSIVLVVLGGIIILGIYMVLTRNKTTQTEEVYTLTAVDEITTTNLEKNYPADARKVVELYAKIMKIMYKETYTEEQCDKMINVLGGLMDDELMKDQTDFSKSIKNEIAQKKNDDYSIPTFVVQAKEPKTVKVDGRKMCNVECFFSLRKGTAHINSTYEFVMRMDSEGKWKILGWTVKDDEEK